MLPEPKLVAYQLLAPNFNHDQYRVELYYIEDYIGGVPAYYLAISGSHGLRVYLTDEEASSFKQKENIILVPSEEDFIRRNE